MPDLDDEQPVASPGEPIDPSELPFTARALAARAVKGGGRVLARRSAHVALRRRQDGYRPRAEGSLDMVRNMVDVEMEVEEFELAVFTGAGARRFWGVWECCDGKTRLLRGLGWRRDGTVRVLRATADAKPSELVKLWIDHGVDEVDPDTTPPTPREAALTCVQVLGAQLISYGPPNGRTACPVATAERVQRHLADKHGYQLYPYVPDRVIPADPTAALHLHELLHEEAADHDHARYPLGEPS